MEFAQRQCKSGRPAAAWRVAVVLVALALGACVHTTTSRFGGGSDVSDEKAVADHVALGMAYLRNGDTQRAKVPLQRAMEIDPRSSSACNAMAFLYQLEEEWELAESFYRKSLQYDPANTSARNNFGTFLYRRSRYAEAAREFEQASEDTLYPARAQVFVNLGLARQELPDTLGAEFAFNRALTLNPEIARAHLELAAILFERGEHDAAKFHFQRFAGLSRHTARSLWLGIRLQRILGDKDALASYELQLKNMFPSSEEYQAYRESL